MNWNPFKKVPTGESFLMDPRDILFSLPTICDVIPESTAGGEVDTHLHEDDWRQVELISSQYDSDIDVMIGEIRNIYTKHRVGPGFDNVYVRSKIGAPLEGVSVTLEELRQQGFAMSGILGYENGTVINNGFTLASGGLTLYGLVWAGEIRVCGLVTGQRVVDFKTASAVAEIASSKSLVLVNWVRCLRLQPDDIIAYLTGTDRQVNV